MTDNDTPEPLAEGYVDLGVIATEYFLLGIDPYPRKEGAVFEATLRRIRAKTRSLRWRS